ncbi:MAG TPA: c-type cytochrome domain-containing protein, partial [Desulfobacteria bacterium]|nr:c-type cytochrome domain-containing protein [Desulfobacteria bacterium]
MAGDPDKSELFRRISSSDEAVRMPPAAMGHAKLSDAEIDLIRRWIEQGAKWQGHWSFIPPKRPELPPVKNRKWPRNPIDTLVLHRLEREGLTPAAEADKATL